MARNEYIIKFGGLAIGNHTFQFEIGNKFFENNDLVDFNNVHLNVNLEFIKQSSLIVLNFHITGTLGLQCDRCLIDFDQKIEAKHTMFVKHGNEETESEEVIMLAHGETEVDLSQALYEFVILASPQRRVPCDTNKKIKCDTETLKKLDGIIVEEEPKEETNPIWDKLKNINNNN